MVDITFSKGVYSAGIHVDSINEEYSNKLTVVAIPTTKKDQPTGKKDAKVVDLLRITHQFVIKGKITNETSKTAKEIKENLFKIATGGGIAGGNISMSYEGDIYEGYLEKIVCIKEADDSINETSDQVRKYTLDLTFVVGTAA